MNSYILVARAVAGVTFQRIFRVLAGIITLLYLIVVVVIVMLMQSLSPWWGICFVVMVPVGLFLVGVGCLVWRLSHKLLPRHLNHDERRTIHQLSSKVLAISEQIRTPLPMLATMIAVDILRRHPTRTIENLASAGTDLRHDIEVVARMIESSENEQTKQKRLAR